MKVEKIINETTNRGEFNRAYKRHLESTGKIHCAYCRYHKGENKTTKYYGGYEDDIKYPNWKLVSKNKKQWMKKTIKTETKVSRFYKGKYIEIII